MNRIFIVNKSLYHCNGVLFFDYELAEVDSSIFNMATLESFVPIWKDTLYNINVYMIIFFYLARFLYLDMSGSRIIVMASCNLHA